MFNPVIKRVNTIAIKFKFGERSNDAVKYLLKDIFELDPSDILGVGNEGKSYVHVKFKTESVYRHVCDNYHGKSYWYGETTELQIYDISTYSIRVEIKNVPFELSNSYVEKVLNFYGTVNKIECKFISDDWFNQTLSMDRVAYMKEITKPIPSTLLLNVTGTYIYFSYPSQKRTCNRCGSSDHTAPTCNVNEREDKENFIKPHKRENAFHLSLEDFPDLADNSQMRKEEDGLESLEAASSGTDMQPEVQVRKHMSTENGTSTEQRPTIENVHTQENLLNAATTSNVSATIKSSTNDELINTGENEVSEEHQSYPEKAHSSNPWTKVFRKKQKGKSNAHNTTY